MSVVEACHYVLTKLESKYIGRRPLVIFPNVVARIPRLEELAPWIQHGTLRPGDSERIRVMGSILVILMCKHVTKTLYSINALDWEIYNRTELRKKDKVAVLDKITAAMNSLLPSTPSQSPSPSSSSSSSSAATTTSTSMGDNDNGEPSAQYGLMKLAGYFVSETNDSDQPMKVLKPQSVAQYQSALDRIRTQLRPYAPHLQWMSMRDYAKITNVEHILLIYMNQLGDPTIYEFSKHMLEQRLHGSGGILVWYRFAGMKSYHEILMSGINTCKCNKGRPAKGIDDKHDPDCDYNTIHRLTIVWPERFRKSSIENENNDTINYLHGSYICLANANVRSCMVPLSSSSSSSSSSSTHESKQSITNNNDDDNNNNNDDSKTDEKNRYAPTKAINRIFKPINPKKEKMNKEDGKATPKKKKKAPAKKKRPNPEIDDNATDNYIDTSIPYLGDVCMDMIQQSKEEAKKKFRPSTDTLTQTTLSFM